MIRHRGGVLQHRGILYRSKSTHHQCWWWQLHLGFCVLRLDHQLESYSMEGLLFDMYIVDGLPWRCSQWSTPLAPLHCCQGWWTLDQSHRTLMKTHHAQSRRETGWCRVCVQYMLGIVQTEWKSTCTPQQPGNALIMHPQPRYIAYKLVLLGVYITLGMFLAHTNF